MVLQDIEKALCTIGEKLQGPKKGLIAGVKVLGGWSQ